MKKELLESMKKKKSTHNSLFTDGFGVKVLFDFEFNDNISYFMAKSYGSFTCKPLEERIQGILWLN